MTAQDVQLRSSDPQESHPSGVQSWGTCSTSFPQMTVARICKTIQGSRESLAAPLISQQRLFATSESPLHRHQPFHIRL